MSSSKEQLDTMRVPEGKVVFLGSNPSCSSPYHDPFSHCRSATRMLSEWIPTLGLTRDQVHFMNVANYKTPRNRPLKVLEIEQELPRLIIQLKGQVVVTLGKVAQIAMDKVTGYYLLKDIVGEESTECPLVINLPHPSGLNRQLNDRKWVQETLEKARTALDKWKISTP